MDNLLITDGKGFIGYRLCSYLLKTGMKVIYNENLTTGSLQNIHILQKHEGFYRNVYKDCSSSCYDEELITKISYFKKLLGKS